MLNSECVLTEVLNQCLVLRFIVTLPHLQHHILVSLRFLFRWCGISITILCCIWINRPWVVKIEASLILNLHLLDTAFALGKIVVFCGANLAWLRLLRYWAWIVASLLSSRLVSDIVPKSWVVAWWGLRMIGITRGVIAHSWWALFLLLEALLQRHLRHHLLILVGTLISVLSLPSLLVRGITLRHWKILRLAMHLLGLLLIVLDFL